MKKNAMLAIALLAALLVSGIAISPTAAADYSKVGVKSGDNATYAFNILNSTVNLQGQVVMNATSVSGTNATLNLKYYFANGSLAADITLGPNNVSLGQGGIGFFLICADLSANDPIAMGLPLWINETIDMVAAGVTRTVNHLNATLGGARWNIWFDRPTGLMVKLYALGPVPGGLGNFTLTSTSLWSAPGLPVTTLLLIGAGAIIVVGVAAIVLRRRGK